MFELRRSRHTISLLFVQSLSFAKALTQYYYVSRAKQPHGSSRQNLEEADYMYWHFESMSRSFEVHAKESLFSTNQSGAPEDRAADLKKRVMADMKSYDDDTNKVWNVSVLADSEASQYAYDRSSRHHSQKL